MKLKNIIIISLLFLLSSCGYKIINNLSDYNFSIKDINLSGEKNINNILKRSLIRLSDNPNTSYFYELKINSKKDRSVTSKDSSGNASSYKMKIIVSLDVLENNELIKNKVFLKDINYDKLSSNFALSQYENILTKDLTNEIKSEINNFQEPSSD